MDSETLEQLRIAYNHEHPREPPIRAGSTIWKQIQKRMHAQCASSRQCVVSSLLKKPDAPSSWNSNLEEWLSSLDLERAQHGYTKLFPDYYFVGCVPIDFEKHSKTGKCLVSALCSLDIRALFQKGFRRIGIIFNTDVSTGPGEHWVAAFCDLRPELEYARMTYFDSYAQTPEPEIQRLMRAWKSQWDTTTVHPRPMQLSYNKTRHQFKDAQCGMYSLYFLHCCLNEVPMAHKIPDDVMMYMRPMFFRFPRRRE
jgi:hypothetical protein